MGEFSSNRLDHRELSELVIRATGGDNEAFEQLYNATWKQIYYILLGKRLCVEDSKEILQEIYVKVYASLDTLNNPMAFIAWLNRITHNTYVSFLRKKGLEIEDGDIYDMTDSFVYNNEEFLPEHVLEQREVCEQILDIVNDLPEQQRLAIIMHYYEDLTPSEISEITSASENTVYKRLHDAKKTIKAKVIALEKKVVVLRSMSGPLVLSKVFSKFAEGRFQEEVGSEVFKGVMKAAIPAVAVTTTAHVIAKGTIAKIGAMAAGMAVVIGTASYVYNHNIDQDKNNTTMVNANTQVQTQTPADITSDINDAPASIDNSDNKVYYTDDSLENAVEPQQEPFNEEEYSFIPADDVPLGSVNDIDEPDLVIIPPIDTILNLPKPTTKPLPEPSTGLPGGTISPGISTLVPTQPPSTAEINAMLEDMEIVYSMGYEVSTERFLSDVSEETGNAFPPIKAEALGYGESIPTDTLGPLSITVVSTNPSLPFEGEVSVEIIDEEAPKVSIATPKISVDVNIYVTEDTLISMAGVTASDNSGTANLAVSGYDDINFMVRGKYPLYVTATDPSNNKSVQKVIIVTIE